MIREIISRLTMIRLDKPETSGLLDNKKLKYYQDYYFQQFLSVSRWGSRMRIK
jgi:hypothetical protein